MFLIPLSLYDISELEDPAERVSLGARGPYEAGLQLVAQGGFEAYEREMEEDGALGLCLFWFDAELKKPVQVKIHETQPRGPLQFSCSYCLESGRQARQCRHQWASYVILWQSLTQDEADLVHPELQRLARELRGPEFLGALKGALGAAFEGVVLDSLSLFLDETPVAGGKSLGSFLDLNFKKYKPVDWAQEKESLSPRLWHLPEVFRRKLTAFSERYFNEVNLQNRLSGMLRYNFSNGVQLGAHEILRHPLHRRVPAELLPQAAASAAAVFAPWPSTEVPALQELERIMQALLASVARWQRQKRVDLYLQSPQAPGKALLLHSLEFEPGQELDWRVEFTEPKELRAEFTLISFRKKSFSFFTSFALEPSEGVLVVHPWELEFARLQEAFASFSEEVSLSFRERPQIEVFGEGEAKRVLKFLRTRALPVKITGESRTLEPQKSLTQLHLQENGEFYLQHEARVPGQKTLLRKGWTSKAEIYLETLSQGLPFLLNIEARELASRRRAQREWDLKLLKHLGVLRYVFLETLSWHFTGALSDGAAVSAEELFSSLHGKIHALLVPAESGVLARESSLAELCSKAVLACFEDVTRLLLKSLGETESFLCEQGEILLEGVLEREARLLFVLLKRAALQSGGEFFKKSRSGFSLQLDKDGGDLVFLQELIPHGFKLFYKEQALQELADEEFRMDFLLETPSEKKDFNWFELNPRFFLRGEEVDAERFLSLGEGGVVEYEGKLFLLPRKALPSLRRLEFFWQKLQKGRAESTKKKKGEMIYQLPRHQVLELLALRASGIPLRGDEEWRRLCAFYDSLGKDREERPLPPSLRAELKAYQKTGVRWLQDLYQMRLGALLADEMGLGKTLQTLAFLEDLRGKEELGAVLVVVPSSLIFNWQSEMQKFTPALSARVFSRRDQDRIGRQLELKEPVVVLTTYGLLLEHGEFFNQYPWNVLVFDEAQNLKNITTQRASAARSLRARFKICLTGTPMENHFGELYSLVDLLVPGSLGRKEDFQRQFVRAETLSPELLQDLKLRLKPLLLRRTKKEILDQLPQKQETRVSIAFEERQKKIYRDIALAYNRRVQEAMASQGEAQVQLQMLTALLRLRQVCSDPGALPEVSYELVPPKLETLRDSLREITEAGESALVFTQFLKTLEHSAELLRETGIPVFVLHGGLSVVQRQRVLAAFQAETSGGAVLLMTLKTGGVGLNLTKASYVFHLEPWWNPSVENQATDRAHRLGQTRAVQVFRYIMHESLEEKMEMLKEHKERRFQALFTEAETTLTHSPAAIEAGNSRLSKEDFDLLLGLS